MEDSQRRVERPRRSSQNRAQGRSNPPRPRESRSHHSRKQSQRKQKRKLYFWVFYLGVVLGTFFYYRFSNQWVVEIPKDVLSQTTAEYVEVYWRGDTPSPKDFVNNLLPDEIVAAEFVGLAPSTDSLGRATVGILLTDDQGAEHCILSQISVRREDPTPLIEGVQDIEVFIGDTIAYRAGVTAEDLYGDSLDLNIDASGVDVKVEGVYPVVYNVADDYGNTASADAQVYVDENTKLLVETYIDGIFDNILSDNMTQREQAYAIYLWCRNNIRYASSGPHDDIYVIAYAGLRGQPGDCYTYFSILYLMLEQAGIPVVRMERIEGTAVNHVWVAANTGNGWYHIDACPTFTSDNVFMYSDSQIRKVTAATDRIVGYSYHYFDYRTPLEGDVTIEEY